MMGVFLALKTFLSSLIGQHICLVQLDIMTVVAFINHKGGLRSCLLNKMTRSLLFWAQKRLLSLRAVHVPGRLTDMLSNGVEWRLHPQMVQKIWSVSAEAKMDLFATNDNYHCPNYFLKQQDSLAYDWPSARLYAFPAIPLSRPVNRQKRLDP